MKKNLSLEGVCLLFSVSSSSSPAHVLLPLRGLKSVFISVIFEKAVFFKTPDSSLAVSFLKASRWDSSLQERQAVP